MAALRITTARQTALGPIVPMRKVPLIAKVAPEDALMWASKPAEGWGVLLRVFEYVPHGGPREVGLQLHLDLLSEMREAQGLGLVAKLRLIPPNHFVYVKDLKSAYTAFIDLFMTREDAQAEGMGLDWFPAEGRAKKVLAECRVALGSAANPSKHEPRTPETAAKHNRWANSVIAVMHRNRRLSHKAACKHVADNLRKVGEIVEPETIRSATASHLPNRRR